MPHALSLDGVGFSVGARPILRNIAFSLSPADRAGLIGENGSGKSTLLRLIADELTPSSGVIRTGGQRIGLLHQALDAAPGQTVRQVLDAAVAPAHRCLERLDRAAAYLRDVVAGWPGPVLIASHDRAFLDEAVTTLIDLDPAPSAHRIHDAGETGGAQVFRGTYGAYLRHRTARGGPSNTARSRNGSPTCAPP
ncbi:ATP-binding cassette domain-containing protein [Corynebacterium mastitidis]|uniref:ATP-binding cassette domain-containing protein n=1 Tax=Corynebacterium mastitidis TaxID=161890 RepID=UPI00191C8510|nr:ATP-binding cassette domain-containing protein [Corynebacterium mastitidis]MCH6196856.1 ATP-binding cassette domain-containing protein [Corynebacterium mastitidis]